MHMYVAGYTKSFPIENSFPGEKFETQRVLIIIGFGFTEIAVAEEQIITVVSRLTSLDWAHQKQEQQNEFRLPRAVV